jgi:hypothetical protein
MHVREDRRYGAGLAGRFGSPRRRAEVFDQNLVHAIIGGKNPRGGPAELRVNFMLRGGHGALLLDLSYFRASGKQTREQAAETGTVARCKPGSKTLQPHLLIS